MMDWLELKARKSLDPKTPAEYVEAIRRFTDAFIEMWDNLEDGDGEHGSLDNSPQTKTDLFILVSGCAQCALDNIREFRKWHPS